MGAQIEKDFVISLSGEMHTVTVGGITVGYGGLSYVNQVIKNPDYATEEMFAAAKALFAYNKLAEAYFN